MEVTIQDEVFQLCWQKALVWKRKNMLVMADLHLGKVNHFRKWGIPVPLKANNRNLEHLVDLILTVKPNRMVFLGDLFHSHYNSEWEVVKQLVAAFKHISIELVLGNHDILSRQQYRQSNLLIHTLEVREKPFIFTHQPMPLVPQGWYNISGHLHPGVQLTGRGKQSVTLPCFHFGQHQACLPAFGTFTGVARIRLHKTDRVFAIVDQTVMSL